jgi:putative sporulation protein YtaF
MLHLASIVLLAFAVSLDSFGVGLNYGLRRIKLPKASIAIIALCSGIMMLISMLLGSLIVPIIPEHYGKWAGGAILIVIGAWAVLQMLLRSNEDGADGAQAISEASATEHHDPKRVWRMELRSLGIVIEILRTPSSADMDRSGSISPGEAALLGTALSLDAFGAGIGAAFLGLSPWMTSGIIAIFCASFLWLGICAGIIASRISWVRKITLLPGFILIALGLVKILQL